MNGDDQHLVSRQIDAFVGVSSTEGVAADEEPKLELAFDRAAKLAAKAGYVGELFHVAIEIVPEEHNQWIRTFRVIITPD